MKKLLLLFVCVFMQIFMAQAQLVTTVAGSSAGYLDGTGTAAMFANPQGIATDLNGNVYIADSGNHRIRKMSPTGVVTTLAGSGVAGYTDGRGITAQFRNPMGIAVDTNGFVYVADSDNNRVRKISPIGDVTTLSAFLRVNRPLDVAVDNLFNVYVVDSNNHRIRKITSAGAVSTFAGSTAGFSNGNGTAAQFSSPRGITIGPDDNIYVSDLGNESIRMITPSGVVTTFVTIQRTNLTGLVVDVANNVYVTSSNQIYKVDYRTRVSSIYLGDVSLGSADGFGSQVRFYLPVGLAKNSAGDIFVADSGFCRIRKVTPCIIPLFSNLNGFYSEASLTNTSLNGVTGAWSPAFNNTVTTTYTFTPAVGQCANSVSVTIYINNPNDPGGLEKRLNNSSDLISEITIYPNPVNNVLNIETELKLQSVEIYNTQGQKVLSSNQKQINVSNLATGIYIVRIQDVDNKIATEKIVIK